MRIGITLPNNQGIERLDDMVALAVDAEAAGVHSVWVSEHLFHASYVEQRLGARPYHEALVVLTAVAQATRRIRLGTSVLVLPWHHPVRLAKTIASLDWLSDGRVILGAGVGAAADEYAALGVDFAARGRIADDALRAMRALWTQAMPAYSGRYYSFAGLRFEPKPTQPGGVPILIGGNSAAALRRVLRHNAGWQPLSISPDEVAAGVAQLAASGTPAEVVPRVVVSVTDTAWDRPIAARRTARGTKEELHALLHAYAAAGATELILDANTANLDETRALFELFAPWLRGSDVTAGGQSS